jgi:phenylacetic acid degradation operon negative regulatory protein
MSTTRNTRGTTALTARSVLASVLLGTDGAWLPTPRLVRTAELFGITEGTARTALSRMVSAGEAEGVEGGYRLVGRLAARQQRQSASRAAATLPWDGTWELAMVHTGAARPAGARALLRTSLRELRLGELREGVWARPDNLDPDRSPEASHVAGQWCQWWVGAQPNLEPDVDELFELDDWAAVAEELRDDIAGLTPRLEAGEETALAAGFVTSADVLRHLQHDPLLPVELLPEDWPGDILRQEYDRYDAAYRALLRTWLLG